MHLFPDFVERPPTMAADYTSQGALARHIDA
jgi:hypothetical protein